MVYCTFSPKTRRRAWAITWADEWRSTSSDSGSRSVRIETRVRPGERRGEVDDLAIHLGGHGRLGQPPADPLGQLHDS